MSECQRKGKMKVIREEDPDTAWMELDGGDGMEDDP